MPDELYNHVVAYTADIQHIKVVKSINHIQIDLYPLNKLIPRYLTLITGFYFMSRRVCFHFTLKKLRLCID